MAAFKWTGAVLVLFSAGGLGIWSAMQWKGRLRMLETLRQMIYFLKGEITYSRAPLAEALEHLGYLDVDMQERTLKLYLEQLDLTIDYLRQNQREKCRLYTSLGIMGGMFLVIVMF